MQIATIDLNLAKHDDYCDVDRETDLAYRDVKSFEQDCKMTKTSTYVLNVCKQALEAE